MPATNQKVEVLTDRPPEEVEFTPISEGVEPLTFRSRYAVEVKLYALTEDLLPRKQMIPQRDGRWCKTGYRLILPESVRPMIFTTPNLLEKNLEAFSLSTEAELLVRIQSFNQAQAIYLEHGTPLAIVHFIDTISIQSGGPPTKRP